MNKYNWKGIKYPSGKDDWKKFKKNNPAIDLNECTSCLHLKTKFEILNCKWMNVKIILKNHLQQK